MNRSKIQLFVVFFLVFVMLPIYGHASIVARGTCGDNVNWTLSDKGLLKITGEGEITNPSWNGDDLRNVIIEDGIIGTIKAEVCLMDADGKFVSCFSDEVKVTGYVVNPISINASFDKNTVKAGQSLTCSWTIKGAKKPYQYLNVSMIAWKEDRGLKFLAVKIHNVEFNPFSIFATVS